MNYMKGLTKRQQGVLEFMYKYMEKHWNSPTYEEIRVFMLVASPNAVRKHLVALQKKGYIVKPHGAQQTFLTDKSHKLFS